MQRLVAAALVLASLVFSVGGVALIGRADSAQSSESAGQCREPVRHDSRVTDATFPADAGDTVVLNTRGYNYADPGMAQMDPMQQPAAAPSQQSPASPEKP